MYSPAFVYIVPGHCRIFDRLDHSRFPRFLVEFNAAFR